MSPHRIYHCAQAFLQFQTVQQEANCLSAQPAQHFLYPGVPRAYDDQGIHAQTIISFVFPEPTMTRASMPKP